MRCAYVLMYMQKAVGPDKKEFMTPTPYAVFKDAITAEKMKRPGDEVISVPYFSDETPNMLSTGGGTTKTLPDSSAPWTVTWSDTWSKEGSTAEPPPSKYYPKVTCKSTIDEHTWRDRSD